MTKPAWEKRIDRDTRELALVGRAPALSPRLANKRAANNYLKLAGGHGFALDGIFPFDDTDRSSVDAALAAAQSACRREATMATARGYDVTQKPIRITTFRPVEGLPVVRYVGDLIDLRCAS